MNNPKTLESLLEKGIITQEEFDHLECQRNPENLSLFRKIFSKNLLFYQLLPLLSFYLVHVL